MLEAVEVDETGPEVDTDELVPPTALVIAC